MKCQLIILLAIFGLFVATTTANENASGQLKPETMGVQTSGRANFVMQKLFDFNEFREKFNKHYPNAAEIARRTKLFMARAFAVFISGVKYMYHKETKFLKINPRSDWTQKERQASMNLFGGRRTAADMRETNGGDTLIPAVDPEDVERVFAEVSEREHNNNDGQLHQRKRRSADSSEASVGLFSQSEPTRHLSMEELSGDSLGPVVISPKYKPSVPSNNPDYEQLETFSEGADDDEDDNQMKLIPEHEAQQIDRQDSQGNYLHSIMNSIRSTAGRFLSSIQHEDDSIQEQKIMSPKNGCKNIPRAKYFSELDHISLDYRSDGCFLQPKDQGYCGACYIFATTALVEYHHCKQTGKLVPFSEQYAIDCGNERFGSERMDGCSGGYERFVCQFYSAYGVELAVDYPYKAVDQVCPYPGEIESEHMGHTRMYETKFLLYSGDEEDEYPSAFKIERLLKEKGPLFVSIIATDDFSDFGGGVDVLECDLKSELGHSMVIIGQGVYDGIEYWLIRNSHGADFGDEGHYKLAKNSKDGCITRVGYVRGQFRRNGSSRRKDLFDELKDKNLLEQFKPSL